MSNEAKVGAFTLAGLIILSAMLVFFSGIKIGGSSECTLFASFDHVIGLNKSAKVKYAGVPIGHVVSLKSNGRTVAVEMKVSEDIKIPRDSKIVIATSGVLGEKFVSIMPGNDREQFLKDGDLVKGQGERGMDAAMEQANVIMDEVKMMLQSINEVVSNPNVKAAMINSASNVQEMTNNIREMTAVFAHLAQNNEKRLDETVKNINMLTESLMRASKETETMLRDFAGNGQTAANLRMAVENISLTSKRIDNMAKSLETVVTNPETMDDLQVSIKNVRNVSEKADRMLGSFEGTNLSTGLEVMYSGKASHYMTNFDLKISPEEGKFFLLGVNDIGEENKFNAQVGAEGSAFGARIGIIDSKPGIGIDAFAGKAFRFSADAYDLNKKMLKLRAQLRVAKSTYIVTQMNDAARSKKRTTYVGLRHEF